jgi:hypothetical protein
MLLTRRHLMVASAAMGLGACAVRPVAPRSIRVATFNLALNDNAAGGVAERLAGEQDAPARALATIIQAVRPDVILLNELDFDAAGTALERFVERFLATGNQPIDYPYRFAAPVNTGVPSGLDLDASGEVGGGEDAWGYGLHPGQYGMALLSRFPIERASIRTFQQLRWSAMPNARRPRWPDGRWFHPEPIWQALKLSSKSHWDVPIAAPFGVVHVLASHPTPPVFDGPENRNGARNFDEIRFWVDYLDSARAGWIVDDAGLRGGLDPSASFVIVGDLNADPRGGSSEPEAIAQLLNAPRVQPIEPRRVDGQGVTTAAFGPTVGELRVDYVLPSRSAVVLGSGVFWPSSEAPEHAWIKASDHRLVWADLNFDSR